MKEESVIGCAGLVIVQVSKLGGQVVVFRQVIKEEIVGSDKGDIFWAVYICAKHR